jgi:hypothetical protein
VFSVLSVLRAYKGTKMVGRVVKKWVQFWRWESKVMTRKELGSEEKTSYVI